MALGGNAFPEINQITRYESVEDEDSFSRQLDKNVDVYQVHNSKSRFSILFVDWSVDSVDLSKSTVEKKVHQDLVKKFSIENFVTLLIQSLKFLFGLEENQHCQQEN